jgi:FKBP12-rapamycin complex-associated protein
LALCYNTPNLLISLVLTFQQDFWMINPSLQVTIILVVEQVALALGSEFKIYLAQLIPQILKVLVHDTSRDRVVTANVSPKFLIF